MVDAVASRTANLNADALHGQLDRAALEAAIQAQGAAFRQRQKTYLHFVSPLCADIGRNGWVECCIESEAMAKELKRLGFKFCGPVIVYAFMQAVGMVNDHEIACPRRKAVQKL